jgi:hypothetical protein
MWMYTSTPYTPSWHSAWLVKHRDNFTLFYLLLTYIYIFYVCTQHMQKSSARIYMRLYIICTLPNYRNHFDNFEGGGDLYETFSAKWNSYSCEFMKLSLRLWNWQIAYCERNCSRFSNTELLVICNLYLIRFRYDEYATKFKGRWFMVLLGDICIFLWQIYIYGKELNKKWDDKQLWYLAHGARLQTASSEKRNP